jgi:YesN/AraC family two-component response regulator
MLNYVIDRSSKMKLYIRNMVCDRCIMAVENELNNLNIRPKNVALGEVDLGDYDLSAEQLTRLSERLVKIGFAIIDDKKSKIIERIKTFIIEQVHYHNHLENINLSTSLSEELHYDYNYLSNLFSSIEGITIEQFHIHQKIERVKELLVYGELSLSEIAYQQGYSSVAYLSNQFKKITGLTPSHFKKLKDNKQRKPIDKL